MSGPPLLGGIFGTGRSGSTWLGSIVGSHPDVAYRFEPFHRHDWLPPAESALFARVRAGDFGAAELEAIYGALLPSDPSWEKPPFPPTRYRRRASRGQTALWLVARRSAAAAAVFRSLYSPLDRPAVVFKEVDLERALARFASDTPLKVVYVVRHPCATVHSLVSGQERGLMPTGRREVLDRFLRDHAPALRDEHRDRLPEMSACEGEALLWRVSVERCLRALTGCERALLVFYERLCRDPADESRRVLEFLELDPHPQVERFLASTTTARPPRRLRLREPGIGDYFSVFRNPLEAMSRWERELPVGDRRAILELVRSSEAFYLGEERAGWKV